MPHEYAGHYAAKHPPGTATNPAVTAALKENARDGRVSCAAAHKIATDTATDPAEVGKNMDLIELRINKCQMGLFGYAPERRLVKPADSVVPEVADAVRGALRENRVACADCWRIAEAFKMSKREMGDACEYLKVKVSPCQLGAF